MPENEHLLIDIEQGVAILTLNRLKQHNAFDGALISALQKSLEQVAQNADVRVVKITANGPFFCAGGDLSWFKNASQFSQAENQADAALLAQLLRTLNDLPKPTLAVINGPAYGGGVGLVACCDIAIAVETATFALTEVKLGLVPATISPYMQRAMGARALRRYALSAEAFSAQEALRLGLIHSTCQEAELIHTSNDIIKALLQNGPIAMATTKQLLNDLLFTRDDELPKTANLLASIRVSAEAQEGLKAFFDKRKPEWAK